MYVLDWELGRNLVKKDALSRVRWRHSDDDDDDDDDGDGVVNDIDSNDGGMMDGSWI